MIALTFDWLADLAADAIRLGYDVGAATFDPETGPTVGDADELTPDYACLYCSGPHWESDCPDAPQAGPWRDAPNRMLQIATEHDAIARLQLAGYAVATARTTCPHGQRVGTCDGCRLSDQAHEARGRERAEAEGRLRR